MLPAKLRVLQENMGELSMACLREPFRVVFTLFNEEEAIPFGSNLGQTQSYAVWSCEITLQRNLSESCAGRLAFFNLPRLQDLRLLWET